jgi:hypothetical protein
MLNFLESPEQSFRSFRPKDNDSIFLQIFTTFFLTIISKLETQIKKDLRDLEKFDVDDPNGVVSKANRFGYQAELSHLQLPFSLKIQKECINIQTKSLKVIGAIRQDIDFILKQISRKKDVLDIKSVSAFVFTSFLKVIDIQQYTKSRSIQQLWLRESSSISRRPGHPKLFRMNQAYTQVMNDVKKLLKDNSLFHPIKVKVEEIHSEVKLSGLSSNFLGSPFFSWIFILFCLVYIKGKYGSEIVTQSYFTFIYSKFNIKTILIIIFLIIIGVPLYENLL